MDEILGVVQSTPDELDPKDEPPDEAAYHSIEPEEAEASIPNVPVPHLDAPFEPVIVGKAVTVIVPVAVAEPHELVGVIV